VRFALWLVGLLILVWVGPRVGPIETICNLTQNRGQLIIDAGLVAFQIVLCLNRSVGAWAVALHPQAFKLKSGQEGLSAKLGDLVTSENVGHLVRCGLLFHYGHKVGQVGKGL
jgi:hypothetical protein